MTDSSFDAEYRRARAGDAEAFAALMRRYEERLATFVTRRMGAEARRRSDPDDVRQAVALTLWERLAGYPADLGEDELRGYVLQVAKWRIADVVRRRAEKGESHMPGEAAGRETSETGTVTRADERAWTRKRIAELDAPYAEVLGRFYVDGLPIAAIASELGVSVDVVKQRLARGRARLREELGEGS